MICHPDYSENVVSATQALAPAPEALLVDLTTRAELRLSPIASTQGHQFKLSLTNRFQMLIISCVLLFRTRM
jgi:hypothetical protein